jgi:hypothetical protein
LQKICDGKIGNRLPVILRGEIQHEPEWQFLAGGDGTTRLLSGEPSFSGAALLIFLATARFRNTKFLFVGRGLALLSETTPACTICDCQSLACNLQYQN